MATVKEIYEKLEKFAPLSRKADFDNVGLLAGRSERTVSRIMVSLDVTAEVIDEAAEYGAQLIVSHHPMFFSLKSVTDMDYNGLRVVKLIENGLSAICMHTNLDGADVGVNSCLARAAGLTEARLLVKEGIDDNGVIFSYGRLGYLEKPVSIKEYLKTIKSVLNSRGLRYYDAGKPVHKVAVVSGSGGSYLEDVIKEGCDTFVTGDTKYDVFLTAREMGLNIIDADHFCTENLVVPVLKKYIENEFSDIEVKISEKHCQTASFC